MVDLSCGASTVRLEVLGIHFRRGQSGWRNGGILGAAWIRGDPGIRPYRNHFTGERESSLPIEQGIDWENSPWTRSKAGNRRGDSGARRRRNVWILGGKRRQRSFRRRRLVSNRRS